MDVARTGTIDFAGQSSTRQPFDRPSDTLSDALEVVRAREVGASRSVLAERFASFVGHPPMLYLTRWRIQLAASRLAAGAAPLSAVANDVGYESEAAFCRAFKKVTGVTPASWRGSRRTNTHRG